MPLTDTDIKRYLETGGTKCQAVTGGALLLALCLSTAASADNLRGKVEQTDSPQVIHFGVDKTDSPQVIHFGVDKTDSPQVIHFGVDKTDSPQVIHFGVDKTDSPQVIHFGVDKTDSPQVIHFGTTHYDRPTWIPASATTSAEMVLVHWNFLHMPRRFNPLGEVSILEQDIVDLWPHGYRGQKPCRIRTYPIYGQPGSFSFFTVGDPFGPSGWVQDLGYKEKKGWACRYWFASI